MIRRGLCAYSAWPDWTWPVTRAPAARAQAARLPNGFFNKSEQIRGHLRRSSRSPPAWRLTTASRPGAASTWWRNPLRCGKTRLGQKDEKKTLAQRRRGAKEERVLLDVPSALLRSFSSSLRRCVSARDIIFLCRLRDTALADVHYSAAASGPPPIRSRVVVLSRYRRKSTDQGAPRSVIVRFQERQDDW